MDTPPLAKEYTISTLLGGITKPTVDEVILTAAPNSREYPSFSISGPKILPMADAEAIADPAIAPISNQSFRKVD